MLLCANGHTSGGTGCMLLTCQLSSAAEASTSSQPVSRARSSTASPSCPSAA